MSDNLYLFGLAAYYETMAMIFLVSHRKTSTIMSPLVILWMITEQGTTTDNLITTITIIKNLEPVPKHMANLNKKFPRNKRFWHWPPIATSNLHQAPQECHSASKYLLHLWYYKSSLGSKSTAFHTPKDQIQNFRWSSMSIGKKK